MDIAALNRKVCFLKLDVTADKYGNHRNTWTEDFSMYATISGESGSEAAAAGISVTDSNTNVTVRYCSKPAAVTTESHRIEIDGVQYNIRSIDHLNYRKHALKFVCEKEGTGNVKGED